MKSPVRGRWGRRLVIAATLLGCWLVLLLAGAPFLDDVQVWVQRADAPLAHLQLGDHFLGQRPVRARLNVAPFTLAPHEEAVLRVRTRSSGVMSVCLELTRPEAYFAQETQANALRYAPEDQPVEVAARAAGSRGLRVTLRLPCGPAPQGTGTRRPAFSQATNHADRSLHRRRRG